MKIIADKTVAEAFEHEHEILNSSDSEMMKLRDVTLQEVISVLQIKQPNEFAKMIISPTAEVIRTDYLYVHSEQDVVERNSKEVTFPNYDDIAAYFQTILNTEGDEACPMADDILNVLKQKHNIKAEESKTATKHHDIYHSFPIDEENGKPATYHRRFYIPAETSLDLCPTCNGEQYLECPDCGGRHEWTCPECGGEKDVTCPKCGGKMKIICTKCNGKGEVTCSNCHGNGQVKCPTCGGSKKCRTCHGSGRGAKTVKNGVVSYDVCVNCNGTGIEPNMCPTCRDTGMVRCTKCAGTCIEKCSKCLGQGELQCNNCKGKGTVTCEKCRGNGTIICSKCYGTKDRRYGMIDCDTCKTTGKLGHLSFIETTVTTHNDEELWASNSALDIKKKQLTDFIDEKAPLTKLTWIKLNGHSAQQDNAILSAIRTLMAERHNYSLDDFAQLTNERMCYKVISCVGVNYKHMITGKKHMAWILNATEDPVVVVDKSAERFFMLNPKNIFKGARNMLGRLFNTKAHREKCDRLLEYKLLICMAKADGTITIAENKKLYVSQKLASIDNLTVSEKKELFALMNAKEMPQLDKMKMTVSSEEVVEDILKKLEELGMADEYFTTEEKEFYAQVKERLTVTPKKNMTAGIANWWKKTCASAKKGTSKMKFGKKKDGNDDSATQAETAEPQNQDSPVEISSEEEAKQ